MQLAELLFRQAGAAVEAFFLCGYAARGMQLELAFRRHRPRESNVAFVPNLIKGWIGMIDGGDD